MRVFLGYIPGPLLVRDAHAALKFDSPNVFIVADTLRPNLGQLFSRQRRGDSGMIASASGGSVFVRNTAAVLFRRPPVVVYQPF